MKVEPAFREGVAIDVGSVATSLLDHFELELRSAYIHYVRNERDKKALCLEFEDSLLMLVVEHDGSASAVYHDVIGRGGWHCPIPMDLQDPGFFDHLNRLRGEHATLRSRDFRRGYVGDAEIQERRDAGQANVKGGIPV